MKRSESEYDCFGAGHSSTSISAGLGMAVGRDARGRSNHVVSVIGDGAITGGMAYEAMNHAGFLDSNMIVVLNDNQQVSPPRHSRRLSLCEHGHPCSRPLLSTPAEPEHDREAASVPLSWRAAADALAMRLRASSSSPRTSCLH